MPLIARSGAFFMPQQKLVGARLAREDVIRCTAKTESPPSPASLAPTGLCADRPAPIRNKKNAPDREIRGVFVQAAKFTSLSHLQM
jgi:hypothetical protein